MIGLAISCRPMNTLLRILSLQFTSAPWPNTPRKQFNNFKDTISWSTSSTPFYEHVKFTEHTSTPSRSFHRLGKPFAILNNAKAMKLQKLEKCRVSEKIKNRINNSIMQPIVFIMFISSLLTKLVVKQVFQLPTIYESAKWSASVDACFAGPFSEQILGYQCFCFIWITKVHFSESQSSTRHINYNSEDYK